MPTYDYECEKCGHVFEQFHGMTAPGPKRCPVCKKGKIKRLVSTGGGLIFKGSGFYATDYRSEGYKKASKADQASSDAKPTETKKTESKAPAPKKAGDK
jgi:putative FmdB family regulatory protein